MKKLRFLLCCVLVLATLLALCIVSVSAAAADTWDGSKTSNWVTNNYIDGKYHINNAEDLAAFANSVNGGKTFAGETVVLNCDIIWAAGDASEWSEIAAPTKKWTPIGKSNSQFQGTFDGQGHTVSGLYYYNDSSTCAGFFNYAKGDVTIKNLHVTNSYFNAQRFVGSILAVCQPCNSVTISGCSSDAYVLSNYKTANEHNVGGIAGYLVANTSVTIENCAFTGNITSDFGLNVGGMVGTVNGVSINIDGCLATGTYTGYNRVGGMVGRAYSGLTISNCYADVDLYTWSSANQGGMIGGFRQYDTEHSYFGKKNENGLTISNCYCDGDFYNAFETTLGKFSAIPTRLGNYETGWGKLTSCTYYTDAANFSTAASGNQAALSGTKKGGLSEWLALSDIKNNFKKNTYGDVVLSALECAEHDCNAYVGKWKSNDETGGQYADCLYLGCYERIERDASFEIYGISIKWQSPNGIRFLTKVNKNEFFKDLYTGDDSNYKYAGANVTFGTVIIPANMLAGELTVDTEDALNITAKKMYDNRSKGYYQTEDVFYYTSVIVNFPETVDAYSGDLVARSYMTYIDDATGERVYVYTNTKKISFYEMANKVYAQSNTTESEKQGVNMIMALGAIDEEFTNDRTNKVLYLEHASEALFNEFAASLASQGYTKHTNYKYSGNSFGMYYNDDYVVTFYYTPNTISDYWDKEGSIGENMDENESTNTGISYATDIMRIIVEKRSQIDLPETKAENKYTRLEDQKNSIAYAFMNDNYELSGGMGYIIQLADGSFIIIDGGENKDDPRDETTDTDSDYIWKYLREHTPEDETPVIAAWILTHVHTDHVNAMKAFCKNYSKNVVLEQVIYNFKSGDIAVPTGTRDMERFAEANIKSYFPNVKIHRAHTGYKFYIRNAEISILFSIDDLDLRDDENFSTIFENNESIVFDVVIDGKQRLMFTGDMFIPASKALEKMYGSDLKCDVLQVAHHASQGATLAVNKLFWPNDGTNYKNDGLKFLLVPNPKNTQTRERLGSLDENRYLLGLLGLNPSKYSPGSSQNYNLATKKIYANGDLLFENSLSAGVDGKYYTNLQKTNPSAILSSGAFGFWKTIDLYTEVDTDSKYDNFIPWLDAWN